MVDGLIMNLLEFDIFIIVQGYAVFLPSKENCYILLHFMQYYGFFLWVSFCLHFGIITFLHHLFLVLILTGIGRFVEEAYRGEVQTQILKGLRLYQWAAILSILIGIIMTVIQVDVLAVTSDFGWETFLSAIIGGLFTTFAMGVDFPFSNMRFSRLV